MYDMMVAHVQVPFPHLMRWKLRRPQLRTWQQISVRGTHLSKVQNCPIFSCVLSCCVKIIRQQPIWVHRLYACECWNKGQAQDAALGSCCILAENPPIILYVNITHNTFISSIHSTSISCNVSNAGLSSLLKMSRSGHALLACMTSTELCRRRCFIICCPACCILLSLQCRGQLLEEI